MSDVGGYNRGLVATLAILLRFYSGRMFHSQIAKKSLLKQKSNSPDMKEREGMLATHVINQANTSGGLRANDLKHIIEKIKRVFRLELSLADVMCPWKMGHSKRQMFERTKSKFKRETDVRSLGRVHTNMRLLLKLLLTERQQVLFNL